MSRPRAHTLVLGILFMTCGIASTAVAQESPARNDTLMHHALAEIVINSDGSAPQETYTVQRIALRQLERQNASVVAEFARAIPAAFVQTNSRGESLIYLRSAGERQVALFFNGASMNVPWDNRLNLEMIPTGMIGGMTVAKGVPSILYGTNVSGGVINVTSRELDYIGHETYVDGHYGSLDDVRVGIGHLYNSGPLHVGVSAGYVSRNGIPLADRSFAPFSQGSDRMRTNTDRELVNMFGEADYRFKNGIQAGLSLMHIEGQFGVAPEGHLDPEEASVRFWRYPEWNNTMAILNTTIPIGVTTVVKGALWTGQFGQTIDQFGSVDYAEVAQQQVDGDNTFGLRLSALRSLGPHQLTLAFNGLTSLHEEIVYARDDANRLVSANGMQRYRQHVFSAGAEFAFRLAEPLKLVAGGSLDGIATPETGDKPGRDPLLDYAVNTGLSYALSEAWTLRASAGRKVRFATMRELFGEALNRFLLNPDLKPETSVVTEIGVSTYREAFQGEFVVFHYRVHDTIDQHNVEVDGRRLRQRINLEGSRVYGVEAAGRYDLNPLWTVEGHAALMHARGIEDGTSIRLTEKPEALGALALEYGRKEGLSLMVQGEFTGRAYGRDEDNALVALPTALTIDLKAGYGFEIPGLSSRHAEFYLRGDNLTDEIVLPQLGLPAPGRTISAGIALQL
ncbi:MAG: TonB-dependent receptor [Rhodothermales bacterium]